jgi:hypothetical protein
MVIGPTFESGCGVAAGDVFSAALKASTRPKLRKP